MKGPKPKYAPIRWTFPPKAYCLHCDAVFSRWAIVSGMTPDEVHDGEIWCRHCGGNHLCSYLPFFAMNFLLGLVSVGIGLLVLRVLGNPIPTHHPISNFDNFVSISAMVANQFFLLPWTVFYSRGRRDKKNRIKIRKLR